MITILYIEDNMQNTRLVRNVLHSNGFEMLSAPNAVRGIQLAARERPDLILMDINLPDMTGLEAAQIIKSDDKLAQIPLIAVTGNVMHGDREQFLENGCDGYVPKPISRNELLNAITYYLDLNEGRSKGNQKGGATHHTALSP